MEWLTVPLELREVHWSVDIVAFAALVAAVLSIGWVVVKRRAGVPDEPLAPSGPGEVAPPGSEEPAASRGFDVAQPDVVDPGLSSVLGTGAPDFAPPRRPEYDDETHTEHVSAEDVGKTVSPGFIDAPVPLDEEDAADWSEAETEVMDPDLMS